MHLKAKRVIYEFAEVTAMVCVLHLWPIHNLLLCTDYQYRWLLLTLEEQSHPLHSSWSAHAVMVLLAATAQTQQHMVHEDCPTGQQRAENVQVCEDAIKSVVFLSPCEFLKSESQGTFLFELCQ